MGYFVKELFHTLQGEGAQSGRAAVFCRFSGCNLWSGREESRPSAQCRFCDTDFVGTDGEGGGRFATAAQLAQAIADCWQASVAPRHPAHPLQNGKPYVVFTGGEPLLQLDAELLKAVKARGFETAVETNGTLPAPEGVDWICVSPKTTAPLVQDWGDELKLVYPQAHLPPHLFAHLAFRHFWLQPLDSSAIAGKLPRPPDSSPLPSESEPSNGGSPLDSEPNLAFSGHNTRQNTTLAAARYCQSHPLWRLSLQTHKLIGIP